MKHPLSITVCIVQSILVTIFRSQSVKRGKKNDKMILSLTPDVAHQIVLPSS